MHELVDFVREKRIRGGAILVQVERYMTSYSGDQDIAGAFCKIRAECVKPFMAMLATWIKIGHIETTSEFFIIRESMPNRHPIFSVIYHVLQS